MSFLGGLLGNASVADPVAVPQDYAKLLLPGEQVTRAYRLIRDVLIFTDRRFTSVNVQGVTGVKVSYHSLSYKNIIRFSVESAGHFDLEAEQGLGLWSSVNTPISIYQAGEHLRRASRTRTLRRKPIEKNTKAE
jgi:hypothetical protein